MKRIIEALLSDYERGTLSRRDLVRALALGALPAGFAGRRSASARYDASQDGMLRGCRRLAPWYLKWHVSCHENYH